MENIIQSICEHCKGKIATEVIVENNKVYYKKKCNQTSLCSRVLVQREMEFRDN